MQEFQTENMFFRRDSHENVIIAKLLSWSFIEYCVNILLIILNIYYIIINMFYILFMIKYNN